MTGIKVAKQAIPLNPMDAIKTGFQIFKSVQWVQ
jgi:hypothetical protein